MATIFAGWVHSRYRALGRLSDSLRLGHVLSDDMADLGSDLRRMRLRRQDTDRA
jgi:hypothetical protein